MRLAARRHRRCAGSTDRCALPRCAGSRRGQAGGWDGWDIQKSSQNTSPLHTLARTLLLGSRRRRHLGHPAQEAGGGPGVGRLGTIQKMARWHAWWRPQVRTAAGVQRPPPGRCTEGAPRSAPAWPSAVLCCAELCSPARSAGKGTCLCLEWCPQRGHPGTRPRPRPARHVHADGVAAGQRTCKTPRGRAGGAASLWPHMRARVCAHSMTR